MTRRLALSAAALLAAVLTITGCTTARLPGAAAIVDGHTISADEVVAATNQLNNALTDQASPIYNPKAALFTEKNTVLWLVLAPFIDERVAATRSWVPDTGYNTVMAAIPHASEATATLVRCQFTVQTLSADDQAAVVEAARRADIVVNPRYGTLDLTRGALPPYSPNWIKPAATASPTAAG